MKVTLFPFQKVALGRLRRLVATALGDYRSTRVPQVVSYTAPTGAGKTIIMSALIESIYCGDEFYPEQRNAIFVWLSDSPQLNEQSKLKIDLKADRIRLSQCVKIEDASFDAEVLEDGKIYFLNTQKLSKAGNLTRRSDARDHSIWETLANTVREKSDRLYFIIDEAHRGAQKPSDLTRNTTIMQKFLKGSEADGLPPMPVVIGMTATSERFLRLVAGIQSITYGVVTLASEVRASGLLKDRIVITYPEHTGNEMAVLQAATDEWKDKCEHWQQYCQEQHYAQVNPILVIQVQNGTDRQISATELGECLRTVEERLGSRFTAGQVVHSFGEHTAAIEIGGLTVPYCEPSHIADDRHIKVVFFKEALSTGWDCPRAETMMSFRRAADYTYIAQLLGRMVRTPMGQRIKVDETLNDVHLYLPQFNKDTVYDVVSALQSEEGAVIPTDIEAEELGDCRYDILSVRPDRQEELSQEENERGREGLPASSRQGEDAVPAEGTGRAPAEPNVDASLPHAPSSDAPASPVMASPAPAPADETQRDASPQDAFEQPSARPLSHETGDGIDREGVVRAINNAGLLTYDVRKVQIANYLRSMYELAQLFMVTQIDVDARERILGDIVGQIRAYIEALKEQGLYEGLAEKVLQFKLSAQIFDVFGRSIDDYEIHDLYSTTDMDIDRQFRLAETRLGNEGVANAYVKRYEEEDGLEPKIHVILFAANTDRMDALNAYAREKFHELNDANRRRTVTLSERDKKKYDDIVSDGDIVSKHNFCLPDTIRLPHETAGRLYRDHLFVDNSGTALIDLNGWERAVIAEEERREDFVCWLRNPSRASWALCIPYELDGEKKPMYPDFLIIRRVGAEYVVDILEPHDPTRADNLGKAKGFAEYARQNPGVGRIQLIRMQRDIAGAERAFRLDMSKSAVRDKVSRCMSNDELNHIFDTDGSFQ